MKQLKMERVKASKPHRSNGVLMALGVVLLLGSCQPNRARNSGPARGSALTAPVAAVAGGGHTQGAPAFNGDTSILQVKTVRLPATGKDTLWGYEVYTGDKIFIKQYNVPGIAGKNGFTSAADAEKIGEIVSHKLKTSQTPSISAEELTKAGVQYKAY